MSNWDYLESELDAWAAAGLQPDLWWRDDDAEAPSDELNRLLSLRREIGVPLALAVIPASARAGLAGFLGQENRITILQHGYDHANHAPVGAKKAELCAGRSRVRVIAQLTEGAKRLRSMFGDGFSPILVPPWNRIDAALVPILPKAGYIGLSAFAGRRAPPAVPDLGRADCHIDPIDWRGGGGGLGADTVLDQAVNALRDARKRVLLGPSNGQAKARAPVGLLTHHRVMDDACWDFVREFILRTGGGIGGEVPVRARWICIGHALCSDQ